MGDWRDFVNCTSCEARFKKTYIKLTTNNESICPLCGSAHLGSDEQLCAPESGGNCSNCMMGDTYHNVNGLCVKI